MSQNDDTAAAVDAHHGGVLTSLTILHPYESITNAIIGCYYTVYNALPRRLGELAYAKAMAVELRHAAIRALREVEYPVYYRDELICQYRPDLIVDDTVVLELKCAERLVHPHREQLVRYLEITGKPVGLLFNFGDRAEVRRVENWAELERRRLLGEIGD